MENLSKTTCRVGEGNITKLAKRSLANGCSAITEARETERWSYSEDGAQQQCTQLISDARIMCIQCTVRGA